jgi:transposase
MARTAQMSKEKMTVHHYISRTFKVYSSAVATTINTYDETGSHEGRHRKGRPRVTSAAEDKLIRFTNLRNCSLNKCFTSQHQLFRGEQAFMVKFLHGNHS